MNKELADRLKAHFLPLGIAAYSCNSTFGRTRTYADAPQITHTFVVRQKGIYFIQLFLDGQFYQQKVKKVQVYFTDYNYLMTNWKQERAYLKVFLQLISNKHGRIIKPTFLDSTLMIKLNPPLKLEIMTQKSFAEAFSWLYESSSDESNSSYESK